jgi:outer membrane protein TolC
MARLGFGSVAKWTSVGVAALLLSGCAQFSGDGGLQLVAGTVKDEIGKDIASIKTQDDAADVQAVVRRLLQRPLSADAAVQITLLNNRGLQAAFNELAIAEAQRIGDSLPPNPRLSLSRISGPFEIEFERRIVADIIGLATLPFRTELAAERFRRAQLRTVVEVLKAAAEARRTYYRAVASRELTGYLAQSQQAADTMVQFAKRLGETGAMNKLDQARELAFAAELSAQLASTRQRATSDREALIRHMGLWGGDLDFKLPSALPPLPKSVQSLPSIETDAVRRRIDLQMGRIELSALAKSYGLTQATRFISFLDAGYTEKVLKEKQTGERTRDRGFEIDLEIPIFDFGEVRVREAEATYMAAANRLLELSINARSEARDAYRSYRSSYDIAKHYERDVVPLRKIITDEAQLRYNGMLIDVFALLTEARQRITVTTAAIDAKREFWQSAVNLSTAITIGGGAPASSQTVSAAQPASGGH